MVAALQFLFRGVWWRQQFTPSWTGRWRGSDDADDGPGHHRSRTGVGRELLSYHLGGFAHQQRRTV